MDLSMKWLNDYVKADMPIHDFCAAMTMSGSKVEKFTSLSEPLKNVVVGSVEEINRLEGSEKLWQCQVNVGRESNLQILTAAQNVFKGAVVPVVLEGGRVVNRENGGVIDIKKTKMCGAESFGMFCSFEELGMANSDFPYASKDGILILNNDPDFDKMTVGEDIAKAVGIDDICVEFEITNNRPDCLSVLGLAKEASATFDLPLNYTEPEFKGIDGDINAELKVTVENKTLCRRYMAAIVKNVKIAPSPRWMQERLRASGVRAINNLVDITNFVMLEYGHPMHAFDKRFIDGNEIVVRNARDGEKIVLLDGEEKSLSPEMLVIADANKPNAVAGVMGGEHSGIMNDTTEVVFESACFDGVSVRRTAKKLGVRTESSSRFEKDLDPINATAALHRALQLVEMLGCGEVVKTTIDIDNSNKQPHKLKHDYQWINSHLGAEIPEQEQIAILKKLGFVYEDGYVTVPNVRIDIKRQCDLAEEVARIYGYNEIKSTVPRLSSQSKVGAMERFTNKLVSLAVANGCFECMTYSFISPKSYEKSNIEEAKRRSVVILNPLGEDTSVMRTTMLPSMLEIIARNYNNRTATGRFFEIGREYYPAESAEILPVEKDVLCIGTYGGAEDFYSIKGIVEEILAKCHIRARFTALRSNKSYHPGRCAEITAGGAVIGVVGELHPSVAEKWGIGSRAYAATLSIEGLFKAAAGDVKYKPLPKFPSTSRDLSLICDDEQSSGEIIETISKKGKYLESVTLFDMYKGEQVPEGKKSLSYKLVMRKDNGTITDEEADKVVGDVLAALEAKGITLRK